MSLIAAGVSHQTAPVEERERLAIGPEELPDLLAHFRRLYGNGVVLSTCNRTEIYVHVHHNQGEVPPHELLEQLALWRGLDPATLPRSYSLQEAEVAVACQNNLTVSPDHHLKHAVGRRVLRAHIEQQFLGSDVSGHGTFGGGLFGHGRTITSDCPGDEFRVLVQG